MEVDLEKQALLRIAALEQALRAFVSTIDATGGLNAEGNPVADEDWIDLGDAYAEACEVLGRAPVTEADE